MSGARNAVFWLSYPYPTPAHIKFRIELGQLDSANAGNVDAQNALCARFKQAAGLPRGFRVSWPALRSGIKPTDDTLDSDEERRMAKRRAR